MGVITAEQAYQMGVKDACELFGPSDSLTDDELTEHGRDQRKLNLYVKHSLLRPGAFEISLRYALTKASPNLPSDSQESHHG